MTTTDLRFGSADPDAPPPERPAPAGEADPAPRSRRRYWVLGVLLAAAAGFGGGHLTGRATAPDGPVSVVVATRDLPAGARLTEADLRVERRPAADVPPAAERPAAAALLGLQTTRSLAAGTAVAAGDVFAVPRPRDGFVALAVSVPGAPPGDLGRGDRVQPLYTPGERAAREAGRAPGAPLTGPLRVLYSRTTEQGAVVVVEARERDASLVARLAAQGAVTLVAHPLGG